MIPYVLHYHTQAGATSIVHEYLYWLWIGDDDYDSSSSYVGFIGIGKSYQYQKLSSDG